MKVFLKNYQSPGDILMLTAAIRDLKKAYPYIEVNVSTSCDALFENNPHLSKSINESNADKVINIGYPLINSSDKLPYHFIHGFRKELQLQLGLTIPQGEFKGDIFLKGNETQLFSKLGDVKDYWLLDAGYKNDFTLKNWGIERYQELVNILKDKITFVQIGKLENSHKHEQLDNVIDLRGQTSIRDMIQLTFGCKGVVTPVSFPMHLAAAVPTRNGRYRPCVVIAGGREPVTWEQYPGHQFVHTVGMLSCCGHGGCWKSRAEKLNDGADSDNSICPNVVRSDRSAVGKCMAMIKPERIAELILAYEV